MADIPSILLCPLGHIQNFSSETTDWANASLRICNECGIAFDPRIANKELYDEYLRRKAKLMHQAAHIPLSFKQR